MKSLRSIAFVALALCASAFIAAPAIAAVPADYPAYDTARHQLKSTQATIAVIAADLSAQRCKLPVVQVSTSIGRSIQTARGCRVEFAEPHKSPSVEFFRRC